MSRYYYTCLIKVLYMHAYFGVKFENAVINMQSAKTGGVELTLIGNLGKIDSINYKKIYVAKESEEIFKPINNDLAQFTRDDGISTIAQYDEVKKAFINGNFKILEKYNPKIIMRDNKQFFMPEVEYD